MALLRDVLSLLMHNDILGIIMSLILILKTSSHLFLNLEYGRGSSCHLLTSAKKLLMWCLVFAAIPMQMEQ